VLIAGVLTGFLPCGLVYGFLALASSSASVAVGLIIMVLFGLGTAPLLILAGAGASLLSFARRQSLLRASAVCVCLTGLVSIARGVLFLQIWGAPEVARCLLCG
jgi:sulfite exporter TauE/SafE